MNPFDFPLLADENIHRDVVSFLRTSGSDVQSISEKKKFGLTDSEVLQWANAEAAWF
ncbi:MAG: DUF5615 family PIN-like protein [Chloroflexi bacterium]|nr:DUF5615 family PIN-like protein [Chloroflexota bacterium]